MEELAYRNYKTFIQSSECALSVKRQVDIASLSHFFVHWIQLFDFSRW
jgi:hypothetical protein